MNNFRFLLGRTSWTVSTRGYTRLVVLTAALLVGGEVATVGPAHGSLAAPEALGTWTTPFEEGGAETPRCHDNVGRIECKPVAQAMAVLPDGQILYFNGIEGDENVERSFPGEAGVATRNSRARVLDLRSGIPRWTVPTPDNGGGTNPDIKPRHQSIDDPPGMLGVPGRPGDGLVGSAWGAAGGPPHEPTSPPDDPQDNDTDLFCSDLTHMPDGRVLIAGGTDYYYEPDLAQRDRDDPANAGVTELGGTRMGRVFDHRTSSFTSTEPMKYARWYPSVVSLADGKVLVASGVVKLVKSTQASQVRRTETYDPQANAWAENHSGIASENSLPLYPRLWLAPDGKVFYGATGQVWNPAGQAADEATWSLQQFFHPETKRWEVAGVAPFGFRGTTGDVMLPLAPPYDHATILTFGGTLLPAPGTYVGTTLSTLTTLHRDGTVSTEMTGQLNAGRWFPSGVLLPDGQVFTANGSDRDANIGSGVEIPRLTPELYDPGTQRWTTVADQSRARLYHSAAVLLPDARVLIGGHAPLATGYGYRQDMGEPFANNDRDPSFEVWSPPYLYRGPRPVIRHVHAGVAWGDTFTIDTPDADDIESVQLMRLPSVQHTIDPDQRTIMLPFSREGDILRAVAPPNGTVAPPAYYYLFVNRRTDKGPVPSVARIVRLGRTSDTAEAVQPTADDPPPPAGSATDDTDTSLSTGLRKAVRQTGATLVSGPVERPDGSRRQPSRVDPALLSAGSRRPRPRPAAFTPGA